MTQPVPPASTALPFSKVRAAQGLVFLSGELPLLDDGSVPTGIAAQTDRVLSRIRTTLAGHGLTLEDVVQVAAHLANPADFADFNAAYRAHFSAPYPVRTTVVAGLLVPGALLELTVTAALRD
jgi:enamine deaminase RidA (YjgF/YER057c/UK114 family)